MPSAATGPFDRVATVLAELAHLASATTPGERLSLALLVLVDGAAAVLALAKAADLLWLAAAERRFVVDARAALSADELVDTALRHRGAPGGRIVRALCVAQVPEGRPRRDAALAATARAAMRDALSRVLVASEALGTLVGSGVLFGAMASAAAWMMTLLRVGAAPFHLAEAAALVPLVVALSLALPLFVAHRALGALASEVVADVRSGVDEWTERMLSPRAEPPLASPAPGRRKASPAELGTRRRRRLAVGASRRPPPV